MFNLPSIHRAFSITYKTPEIFIPVRNIKFVINSDLKSGFVQFQIDERYANGYSLRFLPKQYEREKTNDSSGYFFSKYKKF